MKQLIHYRFDGGGKHGFGHAKRSLAMIDYLVRKGHACTIWTQTPDFIGELLEDEVEGITIVKTEEEAAFLSAMQKAEKAILIIDKLYPYTVEAIQSINKHKVIMFHNECDGMFASDYAIFPVEHLFEEVLLDSRWQEGQLKHGLAYFIVLDILKERKPLVDNRDTLVVTTGGTDPYGVLLEVAEQLAAVGVQKKVLLLKGTSFLKEEALEVLSEVLPSNFEVKTFNYNDLIQAGKVITAFGTTVYELLYLGKDIATVGFTPNNHKKAALLGERLSYRVCHLGQIGAIDQKQLIDWLGSDKANQVVDMIDGKAIERIYHLMVESKDTETEFA